MPDRARVEKTIFSAIDDVNELLLPSQRLAKSPETVLMGNESALDSLGLVNLIVATERRVEEAFGVNVVLVDQESMSLKESPFKKIGTLVDYTKNLLDKKLNRVAP